MRYMVVVSLAFILGVPAADALQSGSQELWISVAPSEVAGGNAAIPVRGSEMYVGGPSAGIGIPGQEQVPGAARFSIRSWKEAQRARTFTLTPGESTRVSETEKWGGKPVTIRADLR